MVERTDKAEIRPGEQSEKAKSCRENSGNERHKPQHPHHVKMSSRGRQKRCLDPCPKMYKHETRHYRRNWNALASRSTQVVKNGLSCLIFSQLLDFMVASPSKINEFTVSEVALSGIEPTVHDPSKTTTTTTTNMFTTHSLIQSSCCTYCYCITLIIHSRAVTVSLSSSINVLLLYHSHHLLTCCYCITLIIHSRSVTVSLSSSTHMLLMYHSHHPLTCCYCITLIIHSHAGTASLSSSTQTITINFQCTL